MNPTATSLPASYRGYAVQELVAWHLTGKVRRHCVNRKDGAARRDEIELG